MTQSEIQLDQHSPAEQSADQREALLIVRLWRVGIIAVFFFILFHQEIIRLCRTWTAPDESHGMLIPAFSLYFVYQQRERLARTIGKPSVLGFLALLGCIVAYVLAIYRQFGYPKPILMILTIAALVLCLGGWRIFRLVWLPIFFLWFAIPLPSSIHEGITMPMRILASSIAATILNFIPGIICEASNVLIHGSYQGESFDLNVAEACSGMRLLRAFVALGVAMAYLEKRPWGHRIVLLLSTIPIAIFCNILRVLLTGIIYIFIGPEYAQGTLHSMLGLVMLGVAFGLYGLIAWVMNNLVIEEEPEEEGQILTIKHE